MEQGTGGTERRKKNRNIAAHGNEKYQNRYPLSGILICPYCGKNLRRRMVYKGKIQWLCSTYIKEGKQAYREVRVDDTEVIKRNIIEPTVVEEVNVHGKKHYRYTRKADFISGREYGTECMEVTGGGVLQGINHPRRTVIKL